MGEREEMHWKRGLREGREGEGKGGKRNHASSFLDTSAITPCPKLLIFNTFK